MSRSRFMAIAGVSAGAGVYWHRYRQARRFVAGHEAVPPDLPGERRVLASPWGSIAYRWIEGDASLPVLVLVHGWARTGDSAWWPVLAGRRAPIAVIDLPGHGESELCEEFGFDLAAEALLGVMEDTGATRPVLVAHSMGGPVALTAIRRVGADSFGGLVGLATSAYWVRPRIRATIAMAPYAMGPRSPLLVHSESSDLRRLSEWAPQIAWSYRHRPARTLLREGAAALRRFDTRRWQDLSMPPTAWVVATADRVLPPAHQYASARMLGARVFAVDAPHSLVLEAPDEIGPILDSFAEEPGPAAATGGTSPPA